MKITLKSTLFIASVGVIAYLASIYFSSEDKWTAKDVTPLPIRHGSDGAQGVPADAFRREAIKSADVLKAAELTLPKGSIDWDAMPRGLGAYAEEALTAGLGENAFKAAAAVKECGITDIRSEALGEAISTQKNRDVARLLTDEYHEVERIKARCQTVTASYDKLRLQLLELAAKKGIQGATAEFVLAVGRQPNEGELLAMVADAEAGDILSLVQVATSGGALSKHEAIKAKSYSAALLNVLNDSAYAKYSASTVALANVLYVHASGTGGSAPLFIERGQNGGYRYAANVQGGGDAGVPTDTLAIKVANKIIDRCCLPSQN